MPLPFNIILELYIPDNDDFVNPFCEFERRLHEERKEKRRTRCRYVPGGLRLLAESRLARLIPCVITCRMERSVQLWVLNYR